MLVVVIVTAAVLADIKPAFASYGNTYPWGDAVCAWTGSQTGSCSGYDWGYTTCPSGDGFCTSGNQQNNYYLLDQFGYSFRNCTSYVAWQMNRVFGITLPSNWGNGASWDTSALSAGYTNDASPRVGDIAQWNGTTQNTFGHVAYVYAVTNGVASYAQYNYAGEGEYSDTYTSASSEGPPNNYIHIADVNVPLVGDVNGDGKADAVLVDPNNGDAWVATSTGSSFSNPVLWSSNSLMAGATKYFLADVNGDGNDDLIGYWAATGDWYVALSSGSGFWPPTLWAQDEGNLNSSTDQFVADVNGDHMADVITWTASTGNWYVDESSGSGFYGPPTQWISGDGVGSSSQVVGDFDGDGKADAAVYFASNGDWYVALSTGSSFGYPNQWSQGHGMGSNLQIAGDINGDHMADISYFYNAGSNCGTWEGGLSSGSGFYQPTYWAYNEGCGGTDQFIADVNGDGKADVVTYWENAGATPAGTWSVDESSGSGFYGPPSQWINGFGDNYQ